ncbi:MAG: zinc ABC transporter substrate-binding protein [Firmicutes bacterium]|nr:zinc ABC transporter substrate-binding protein [Bacillota bacterium]
MQRFISMVLLAALLAVTSVGCSPRSNSADVKADAKLNIVATIFPQYDFTRAIVGDKANLTMLISPGASIHSFDPSPADILKISNADVFIYIGGESDAWVDRVLSSMDTSKIKVLRLLDYVKPVEEETVEGMEPEAEEKTGGDSKAQEEEEPEYDEHVWTSPENAITLINAISGCLCERDSVNADFYKNNAEYYTGELKKVDEEIASIIKNARHKKIVVADRFPFRYFVDGYGLEYCAAFSGCSDQTDASAATIKYLVDTVKKDKIPYVFYAELSNQNVAKAVSEQTGAGMLLLNSCHNVTKSEFEAGVTYLSLMKQNAENLRKGLG